MISAGLSRCEAESRRHQEAGAGGGGQCQHSTAKAVVADTRQDIEAVGTAQLVTEPRLSAAYRSNQAVSAAIRSDEYLRIESTCVGTLSPLRKPCCGRFEIRRRRRIRHRLGE
jgi:hypothetical protein